MGWYKKCWSSEEISISRALMLSTFRLPGLGLSKTLDQGSKKLHPLFYRTMNKNNAQINWYSSVKRKQLLHVRDVFSD